MFTKVFEPVTKAIKDTNEDLLKKYQPTAKSIEELKTSNGYIKDLEYMKKNWDERWISIEPLANLKKGENKSHYRLNGDPDGERLDFVRFCNQ